MGLQSKFETSLDYGVNPPTHISPVAQILVTSGTCEGEHSGQWSVSPNSTTFPDLPTVGSQLGPLVAPQPGPWEANDTRAQAPLSQS